LLVLTVIPLCIAQIEERKTGSGIRPRSVEVLVVSPAS
jgi:hypothetical protein